MKLLRALMALALCCCASVYGQTAPYDATVRWKPVLENTDDSPLTDLAGYRIVKRDGDVQERTVMDPLLTSYVWPALEADTYEFIVHAINAALVESAASDGATLTVEPPAPRSPPPCYWSESPCTRGYYLPVPMDSPTPTGFCVQWYISDGDEFQPLGFCKRWADIRPNFDPWQWPYLTKALKDGEWMQEIQRPLTEEEAITWDGLLQFLPPSVYVVAPYRTNVTRPVRQLDSTQTSVLPGDVGRIEIGSPCLCTKLKVGSYCSVEGQEEYVTKAPLDSFKVAVCERRQ